MLKMRLSSLPFLDGLIDAAICCVQQENNCMRRRPHTFPRDGQQRVDSPSTHVAMWRRFVNSYKTNALRVDLPLWSKTNNALTKRRERLNYRWQTTDCPAASLINEKLTPVKPTNIHLDFRIEASSRLTFNSTKTWKKLQTTPTWKTIC